MKSDLEKPHQVKKGEKWSGEASPSERKKRWSGEVAPLKEGFAAMQEREGCLKSDLHAATKEISMLLYKDLNTSCSKRDGTVQSHLKKTEENGWSWEHEIALFISNHKEVWQPHRRKKRSVHQQILHGEHFQHQLHVTTGGHLFALHLTSHTHPGCFDIVTASQHQAQQSVILYSFLTAPAAHHLALVASQPTR